jgi:CBS domain-containing protein
MTTGISVKDAMVSKAIIILQSNTIQVAAELMRKEDIGSLVVCESKKPIGIVTREDIVTKVVSKNIDASKIKVKDIMSTALVTTTPEEDLAVAARKMVKYGYERLQVISMGCLVGIISHREVARVAPAAIEILRERLMIDDNSEEEPDGEDVTDGECEICGSFSEELKSINDKWVCDNCKDEAEGL